MKSWHLSKEGRWESPACRHPGEREPDRGSNKCKGPEVETRESVCLQRSMRGENGRGRHQRSNDRPDHIKPCVLEEGLALSLSEMEQHWTEEWHCLTWSYILHDPTSHQHWVFKMHFNRSPWSTLRADVRNSQNWNFAFSMKRFPVI